MKQGILPLIPSDATDIDGFYSVFRGDTTVTWFHGNYPIRVHPVSDHATQRSMMGFLHLYGRVPQPRIAAALRVHENTVRAAVRLLRLKGDAGFYTPTAVRGPAVMRAEIVPRLLLDVPRQPSDVELEADKCIHRFRLIFDRAGCSYKFVRRCGVRSGWPA
jgi:hypothetical protein